jgi:hypothetical protein
MNKKIFFTFLISFICITSVFGQHEKYKQLWYRDQNWENEVVKLELVDIVSDEKSLKFKLKIINKTADYILFRQSASSFLFPWGNMKPNSEKTLILQPFDQGSRVIRIEGDNRLRVPSFSFTPFGLIRIPSEGDILTAPDFALPPIANDFRVGNCQCFLNKMIKKTDILLVNFRCLYSGNRFLLITPSKAAVRTESNQEFANTNRGVKGNILERGDEDKFTLEYKIPASIVDMQFANLMLLFKNTFMEASGSDLRTTDFMITWDPGKTEGKK